MPQSNPTPAQAPEAKEDKKQAPVEEKKRPVRVPNVAPKSSEQEQNRIAETIASMKDNETKIVVAGEEGTTHVFEVEEKLLDLKQVPVVYLKNCTGCNFTIDRRVTKLFADNLTNCTITVNQSILTRTAEVWRGGDVTLNMNTSCKTLQLDLLTNMKVVFSEKANMGAIVWNNIDVLDVSFADAPEIKINSSYEELKQQLPDTSKEIDQFICRFVEGEPLVERCIRLANGHLSTEREALAWEKRNRLAKDRHVKEFVNRAGITLGRDTTKQKIPRNSPCPCGSGRRYKQCCLNKTQLTGLKAPTTVNLANNN